MRTANWKRVSGGYWVSRDGDVFSNRYRKVKRLKQVKLKSGYMQVCLHRDGKQTMHYVHHLVAQAFIGERPSGMDIDHKDGNKANNAASNLHYVTRRENMRRYFARKRIA